MKKTLTNNIGLKLISILFAVVFWLIVVNIDDPIKTVTIKDIPVDVVDADVITSNNKVYEITSGDTVTVRIKGPRSQVEKMTKDDFVAEAPFSEMSTVNAVPIYVKFRNSKYEKSVEITQKTMSMKLNIEDIISKTYNIEINHSAEPSTGYTVGTETLSPSTVTLQAPESVINKISKAQVDIDLSGHTEDFNEILNIKYLSDSGNVVDIGTSSKTSVQTTTISTKIYSIKEVPVKFGYSGKAADGYEVTETTADKDTIRIAGPNIQNIEEIDIPNEVLNIANATSDVTVDIYVADYLPSGVVVFDEENNSTIKLTAKIEKLVTKDYSLPISEIDMNNIPTGYKAEFSTTAIDIELVGLQKYHDNFTIDSLKAYVDLRNTKEGSNEVIVKITLSDGLKLNYEIRTTVILTKDETSATTTSSSQTSESQTTSPNETTTPIENSEDSN